MDIPDEFAAKAINKQVYGDQPSELDDESLPTYFDVANFYFFIQKNSKTKRHKIISALHAIQDGITNIWKKLLPRLPLQTDLVIRTKIRRFLEKVTLFNKGGFTAKKRSSMWCEGHLLFDRN